MFVGLIRFLFWFLVISYLFKILVRILAPFLMKRFAKNIQERFNKQYQNITSLFYFDLIKIKREGKVFLIYQEKKNLEIYLIHNILFG